MPLSLALLTQHISSHAGANDGNPQFRKAQALAFHLRYLHGSSQLQPSGHHLLIRPGEQFPMIQKENSPFPFVLPAQSLHEASHCEVLFHSGKAKWWTGFLQHHPPRGAASLVLEKVK